MTIPTTEQVRTAYVRSLLHDLMRAPRQEFDQWLAVLEANQEAQIRLLIHDLDNARADGTILTYGQVQERLRGMLTQPTEKSKRRNGSQA